MTSEATASTPGALCADEGKFMAEAGEEMGVHTPGVPGAIPVTAVEIDDCVRLSGKHEEQSGE